jgi:hypothetical protein
VTYCWFKILWERLWHYQFTVHLFHPEIPLPRERDALMIDLFIAAGHTGEELRGLNRCRIKLQMLFLSDTMTANGKQIHRPHMLTQVEVQSASKYKFPRQEPMALDWVEWTCFWTRFTHSGLYLIDPLEQCTALTHRNWTWFYDVAEEVLQHTTDDGVDYYHKTSGRRRTRCEQHYEYL